METLEIWDKSGMFPEDEVEGMIFFKVGFA